MSSSSAAAAASSSVSALRQVSQGSCECEQSSRRVRQLRQQDVSPYLPENSRSSHASPESSILNSCLPDYGSESSHWSSSAVSPRGLHPLPLPESALVQRSNSEPIYGYFYPRCVSPRILNSGDPFPARLSANNPAHSPGRSPLSSPTSRSPCFNWRSSNGNAFALHNESLTKSSSDRAESSSRVNAHPLPLPPSGAVVPLQSSIMHHNAETPSMSSMKGQWQKGKLIGRSTFGCVYLATNRETGALCAMKEVDIIPDDPQSAGSIKNLEQEIKVLRTLKHPNIVQYYGSEVTDDHFYVYLEYVYVQPGSIDKYVKDLTGAMTESVLRNFTRHILSGLAFLHRMKIIHRDIRGANLCVDPAGVVKLADFRMAKDLNGQSYNLSMKDSPYWMAPEVIKAVILNEEDPNLAFAVDIWSLGCTIIEMFNGKPPWSDFTGPQAMFKVLNTTPDIPETLSAEGKDFLVWCFLRDPAERPSAVQLLEHPFVQNH